MAADRARIGFVSVLQRMRAKVALEGDSIRAQYSPDLHGTEIHGAEIPSLDEVPVLREGPARKPAAASARPAAP